jgi:threonine/homoserine/homoserine lactone efflux protein
VLGHFWVKAGLYVLGAAVLIYIGQSALKTSVKHIEEMYKTKEFRAGNAFLAGFSIAISSPIVISFWISLAGSYLSEFTQGIAAFHIFLIASGFLLFFIPLAIAVSYSRKMLKAKWVVWLSWVFGVVLIGYGGKFLYDLLRLFV